MTSTVTRTDRWNGFRFANVQQMEGREGPAYSADITLYDLDGTTRTVGHSRNDGNGGCDLRRFTDKRAEAAFKARAIALHPETDFEVDDLLATDLLTVATLNRKRSILLTTPDLGDFWDTQNPRYGSHYVLRGTLTPPMIAALKERHPDGSVWCRKRGDFIPLAEW